jgi:hypothetical protein
VIKLVNEWSVVVFSAAAVSSTNKTDCHDITEILLKVELNTINQPKIYKNAAHQHFLI